MVENVAFTYRLFPSTEQTYPRSLAVLGRGRPLSIGTEHFRGVAGGEHISGLQNHSRIRGGEVSSQKCDAREVFYSDGNVRMGKIHSPKLHI